MKNHSIYKSTKAVRDDIQDLVTRRALPTPEVAQVDPFLFLNHHGPQVYAPNNDGLPFGPHPHRGFETVTFIIEGDLVHKDTGGHESVIREGGVQWMTTGSGLVHSETSSDQFQKEGGPLEILQLWHNLPSKLKMVKPAYRGLQADQIPSVTVDDGRVTAYVSSGKLFGIQGAFSPLTDVTLSVLKFAPGAKIEIPVSQDQNIFFYVIRGEVKLNSTLSAPRFQLIQFNRDGEGITVEASQESLVLFGHATPYNEPVVSHGPFVMNTREEIIQAIQDYQSGKLK